MNLQSNALPLDGGRLDLPFEVKAFDRVTEEDGAAIGLFEGGFSEQMHDRDSEHLSMLGPEPQCGPEQRELAVYCAIRESGLLTKLDVPREIHATQPRNPSASEE